MEEQPADDRQASLLTETQRKYLRDEKDIEPGSSHERMIQSRIRERVRSGMYDFQLLTELSDEDIDRVFASEWDDDVSSTPFAVAITSALEFFYFGLARVHGSDAVTARLRRAISNISHRLGKLVTVEDVMVDIQVDEKPIDEASVDDLSKHTLDELDQLRRAELITDEEYVDAIFERRVSEVAEEVGLDE